MEFEITRNSPRKKELIGLGTSYIGENIVDDLFVSGDIITALTGSKPQAAPADDKAPFIAPSIFARVATTDVAPGQTASIGQKGYQLVIFQYSFNGGPGGHSSGHSGNYTNGLPAEWRAGDGQYQTITIGPTCGIVTESITVYTYDGQTGSGAGDARVIIPGLQELGPSPDYALIGQTGRHPSNHWATPAAAQSLQAIAREYRQATGDRLYLNDMSLSLGGLFDIGGQWGPPHHEHRDGRQVDIAATPETLRHEAKFVEVLRRHTTNYIIEGAGNSRHYHARF